VNSTLIHPKIVELLKAMREHGFKHAIANCGFNAQGNLVVWASCTFNGSSFITDELRIDGPDEQLKRFDHWINDIKQLAGTGVVKP